MQSTDDFYRRLIKPIRDSFVQEIISSATVNEFSPYDQDFNWSERHIPIKRLHNNVLTRFGGSLLGLETFPHMYVMNGNSDFLHHLFTKVDTMAWRAGDYSYYGYWHNRANKPRMELTEPKAVDDIVVTWPGYSNADNTEVEFALQCNAKRLHLDCAYLGTTEPMRLDVKPFETVSISFSKTLAIPYNRLSVTFSRTAIPEIELLNKVGYINLAGVRLANHIMSKLPTTYWWDTYGSKLKDVCEKNNLTATKSILFAYEKEKRIGLAPYWVLD